MIVQATFRSTFIGKSTVYGLVLGNKFVCLGFRGVAFLACSCGDRATPCQIGHTWLVALTDIHLVSGNLLRILLDGISSYCLLVLFGVCVVRAPWHVDAVSI